MVTEDYVSYEVAKLLKEKGFDLLTDKVYDNQNKLDYQNVVCWQEKRLPYVLAPTLQMACKWLREVHNLHVDVGYDDLDWFWNIISISEDVPIADRPKFIVTGTACHRTYEEAVEAAIKYILKNLI